VFTFKQMEAIFWIVQLGSFEAAAGKLNASQSAISKRIQELESVFDIEVFDRTHRTARLTDKGEELFAHARELLQKRDQVVECVSAKTVLVRRLRLGVTELTALTWLPRLINAIKEAYPKVTVEAEVELGSTLRDRLASDMLDFVIVPQATGTEQFVTTPLAVVENAWMCVPDMVPQQSPLPINAISQFPIVTQGTQSGTGAIYGKFLQQQGVVVSKLLTSNNLIAQIGLTLAGLGISYLPRQSFEYLVDDGALSLIKTTPSLPPVQYVSMYRGDRAYALTEDVSRLALAHCDFSTLLLRSIPASISHAAATKSKRGKNGG